MNPYTLFPDALDAPPGPDDPAPGRPAPDDARGPSEPPGPSAPCPACAGCGLVLPSPFRGDVVPWSRHVASVAAALSAGGIWGSSATAAGLVGPLPCPDCDGSAPLPAAVLTRKFLGGD